MSQREQVKLADGLEFCLIDLLSGLLLFENNL